jgi:2-dehydropantoate 2-reductase
MTTKIAIIGLGGVGGYFGFKLAQAYKDDNEVEITFVARSITYEIVKQRGLTLISPEHPETYLKPKVLLQSVSELSDTDLIMICVKEYDLESVCQHLKEKVNENAVLLPLMNGVNIYDRIRAVLPSAVILPACVYVASHIKEKGTVEHNGRPGKIIFGNDPKHPNYVPDSTIEILQRAAIQVQYLENPFPAIWTKFIFIASFGLISARYNKSIGQVEEDPELHRMAQEVMQEIVAIAKSKGILLPENIIETTFQKASSFPYQTPTSLQLDVQSNKKSNELELFAGAILRYGEEMKLPTPMTEKIDMEIRKNLLNKDAAN